MMKTDERLAVKSVATNFEIIHALIETNGARISELAERLDMPLSTVHDHLNTLEQLDYVVKQNQQYVPGIRYLTIGGQARRNYNIYQVAKPKIDQLALETGDHANLMIEEHGIGTLIYKAIGEDQIQLDTYIGMQMTIHAVAMGKAILAYLPESRVEEIINQRGLKPITENTTTDEDELWNELKQIRGQGYATEQGERIEGVSCIGAPILNENDVALGAISISAPTQKMQGQMKKGEVIDNIRSTANAIEVNLAFS